MPLWSGTGWEPRSDRTFQYTVHAPVLGPAARLNGGRRRRPHVSCGAHLVADRRVEGEAAHARRGCAVAGKPAGRRTRGRGAAVVKGVQRVAHINVGEQALGGLGPAAGNAGGCRFWGSPAGTAACRNRCCSMAQPRPRPRNTTQKPNSPQDHPPVHLQGAGPHAGALKHRKRALGVGAQRVHHVRVFRILLHQHVAGVACGGGAGGGAQGGREG